MLDPQLPARASSSLSLPAWVRGLQQLSRPALEAACKAHLRTALVSDDPELVCGIALLDPMLLNLPIVVPEGEPFQLCKNINEASALDIAFMARRSHVAAALISNKATWSDSRLSGTQAAFISVVVEQGLETAVNTAIEITKLLRVPPAICPGFPRLQHPDASTLSLILKFDQLYPEFDRMTSRAVSMLKDSIFAMLGSNHPLAHLDEIVDAITYVSALRHFRGGPETQQDPAPLTRLALRCFSSNDTRLVKRVVHCVDELVYNPQRPLQIHPAQAELHLLLNHPSIRKSRTEYAAVVAALTAVDTFKHFGVSEIDPAIVDAVWARVGRITFGFPRFKYDSRPASEQQTCLLEEFGFLRIADDQLLPEHRQALGTCLSYRPPNGQDISAITVANDGTEKVLTLLGNTEIILRHGALAVSHPSLGVVWCRNSSPVFGRNSMPYPARFSPEVPRAREDQLHPYALYSPVSLCEHKLFLPQSRPLLSNAIALLDQFEAFLNLYRAWKFDTNRFSAWKKSLDVPGRVSGFFRSPGFARIVDRLSGWYFAADGQSAPTLPSLAFVAPCGIPWSFLNGRDDLSRITGITISPRNLALLQELATGDQNTKAFKDTDLFRYLSHAACFHEGELVMRDPNPDYEL